MVTVANELFKNMKVTPFDLSSHEGFCSKGFRMKFLHKTPKLSFNSNLYDPNNPDPALLGRVQIDNKRGETWKTEELIQIRVTADYIMHAGTESDTPLVTLRFKSIIAEEYLELVIDAINAQDLVSEIP